MEEFAVADAHTDSSSPFSSIFEAILHREIALTGQQKQTISIVGFRQVISPMRQYFGIPRIIAQCLFRGVMKKPEWSIQDFEMCISIIFSSNAEENKQLVFNLLDFNQDGYITWEDCHLLLSLTSGNPVIKKQAPQCNNRFENILMSQSYISELMLGFFKKPSQKMSRKDFKLLCGKSPELHTEIYESIRQSINLQSPSQLPANLSTDSSEEEGPKQITKQGVMFRMFAGKGIKSYYYVLKGPVLEVFRTKDDTESKQIVELNSGFYVERMDPITTKQKKLIHAFALVEKDKRRQFFHLSETECKDWMKALSSIVNDPSAITKLYNLVKPVYNGTKSQLYQGIQKSTGRRVAVKVVKKKGLSADYEKAIQNEIQISKMCKHPHLMELIETQEDSSFIYMIFQFLAGGNLENYIIQNAPVHHDIVRGLAHQLGSAIYYLQTFGIVHRDLKPENVLLTGSTIDMLDYKGKSTIKVPEIKIVDFGLSVGLCPGDKLKDPFGTMAYTAPQILDDKPYDEKIDIYGIGIILYRAITGQLPFTSVIIEELLDQVINHTPEFFSEPFLQAPADLTYLVQHLMEKTPKKRYNIEQMLTHKYLLKNMKVLSKERKSGKEASKFLNFACF